MAWKFTDLVFRIRAALAGIALTAGLLVGASAPSRAQVVRIDQTDPATGKEMIAAIAPGPGNADFVVTCSHHYSIRTYQVDGFFLQWAKLSTQLDRYGALPADGEIKHPDELRITFTPTNLERFESLLTISQRLAVRITEGSQPLQFQFDWNGDSREAFGVTAESYGISRSQAMAAFDTLGQNLSQAAAGQNPALARLMDSLGIGWREGGQAARTSLVAGRIMDWLAGSSTPAASGATLFGSAWTVLQPMAKAPQGDRYTDRDRSMDQQLVWLRAKCGS